jgi:hypothetical protein
VADTGPTPSEAASGPRRPAGLDVAAIAALVRSCPLVAGLHSGRHGRIAVDDGGVRMVGVRVAGSDLVLGVVGQPGATTEDVAAQVRSVVAAHVPDLQVTVSVQGG